MKNLDRLISKIIKEATGDSGGSRGSYAPPMQPGLRPWDKSSLGPFLDSVSDFKSPLVQYDSYDHKFDLRLDQIKELEKVAGKIQDYIKHHPYATFSDEDGNPVNPYMQDGFNPNVREKLAPFTEKVPFNEWVELTHKDVINEINTTTTAGPYTAPVEIGSYKWKDSEVGPFTEKVKNEFNEKTLKNTLKKNLKRIVGVWEKNKDGSYKRDINYPDTINEDLAVWFGKKKKPKGSSQPKGPWVNICRKVDGKHPPCGRHDTSKGSYPKCRAAGVAGKMSDSAKRAACAQKRAAEKKDPQTGKGQKPVMTSYNPRKKTNEQMSRIIKLTESDLKRIITRILKENEDPITIDEGQTINLTCKHLQTGKTKPIEGTVDTQVINAKGGHRETNPDRYVEPEEVIPEFMVSTIIGPSALGDAQEIMEPVYIEKVSQEFKDLIGYDSGYVLTHFENGVRFYCKVNDISDQLKTELVNYGVNF